MSRVFGLGAVRNRKVPAPESFPEAMLWAQRSLFTNKRIVGLLFFGSMVTGTPNHRSDIDCIVLHHGEYDKISAVIRNTRQHLWERFHIPLNIIDVSTVEGPRGNHDIGPGLYLHLQRTHQEYPDACIGINPLPYIRNREGRRYLVQETQEYLNTQVLGAAKKWERNWSTCGEEVRLNALGKAFARPVHAARHYLQLRDSAFAVSSKHQVIEQIEGELPRTHRDILDLLRLDREYNQALQEQLESFNERDYQRTLHRLELAIPMARHIGLQLLHALPSR